MAQALQERGVAPAEALRLAWRSRGCPGIALRALEDPAGLEAQDQELQEMVASIRASLHQRFALAADIGQRFARNRSDVQSLLETWEEGWRDLLLVKEGAPDYVVHRQLQPGLAPLAEEMEAGAMVRALRLIQETLDLLDQNVNPRMALEHLLMGFPFLPPSPTDARSGDRA